MKILLLHNNSNHGAKAESILNMYNCDYICIKEKVKEWPDYDIGISFLYTYRIPKSQLNKTWYNFHPGPLPEYGGRNICYHAIMNEEETFGATLHYIDEDFDTGPIIVSPRFPINNMTAGELSEYTIFILLGLLNIYLPLIKNNVELPSTENNLMRYYQKEPINDYISLSAYQEKQIRALTTDKHSAKIRINGVNYEIKKI